MGAQCQRCNNLNRYLQEARKEILELKRRNDLLDQRARDRKAQINLGVATQLRADAETRAAVLRLIERLVAWGELCEECTAYFRKAFRALLKYALAPLDKYHPKYTKRPPRKRDEHAMPRHGKQSS